MSCADNSSSDVLVAGREAWARLQVWIHHTFSDWLIVGTALAAIQSDAMVAAQTNQPKGRRYCKEAGELLREAGLDGVDKGCRSRLLKVLEHQDEIQVWLAKLEPAKRVKLNHPAPVWATWSKAMALETTKPKPAQPELLAIWKNASIEERRAALDDGGLELLFESISPELRSGISRRLIAPRTADEILGERIRDLVDEIRALAVHFEQNRAAIAEKFTAIKRATRGVGKTPTTTPMKVDPAISEALKAMGNGAISADVAGNLG
jgi:hypothetical protein